MPKRYNGSGEDKFVMMIRGLHIEMALLIVLGDWLDGSGWVSVIMAANIITNGRGGALKKGHSQPVLSGFIN